MHYVEIMSTTFKFNNKLPAKGFTLVEMMIVVAIIGILSAIAFPSYSKYIMRGRRADAQAFLLDVAQRQQQYLLDARTYAGTLTDLTLSPPASVALYYNVAIVPGTGTVPTFTASATPIIGSPQATDPALTINEKGVKSPVDIW